MNNKATFFIAKESKEMGSNQQLITAVIAGEKATTSETFLAEIARALKFPEYFGNNYDALDEMLNDLSWLTQKEVTCCFKNTIALLKNNDAELAKLLHLLYNTLTESERHKNKKLTIRFEYSERIINLLIQEQLRYKLIL